MSSKKTKRKICTISSSTQDTNSCIATPRQAEIEPIELYKLYVDSAEKTTDRRSQANSFYVTLCTGLAGVSSYLSESIGKELAIVGIFVSFVWFLTISNYKSLNSIKYKVILEMEKGMKIELYSKEWTLLHRKQIKYVNFSTLEKIVPWVFILLYLWNLCGQIICDYITRWMTMFINVL